MIVLQATFQRPSDLSPTLWCAVEIMIVLAGPIVWCFKSPGQYLKDVPGITIDK